MKSELLDIVHDGSLVGTPLGRADGFDVGCEVGEADG